MKKFTKMLSCNIYNPLKNIGIYIYLKVKLWYWKIQYPYFFSYLNKLLERLNKSIDCRVFKINISPNSIDILSCSLFFDLERYSDDNVKYPFSLDECVTLEEEEDEYVDFEMYSLDEKLQLFFNKKEHEYGLISKQKNYEIESLDIQYFTWMDGGNNDAYINGIVVTYPHFKIKK